MKYISLQAFLNANSATSSFLAMEPYMMNMRLGGIIGPIVEEAAVTAALNLLE